MVIFFLYNVEKVQWRYAVQGSDTTMLGKALLLGKK